MIYLLENTIQRLNNSDQVNAHRCEFLKRAVALCLKHYQEYNIMDNINAMVMGFVCPLGYSDSNINQKIADRSILTF